MISFRDKKLVHRTFALKQIVEKRFVIFQNGLGQCPTFLFATKQKNFRKLGKIVEILINLHLTGLTFWAPHRVGCL